MGIDQPEELIERFRRCFVLGGYKAASLARLRMRICLLLLSQMGEDFIRRIGLEPVVSLQTGMDALLAAYACPRALLRGRSVRVLAAPFGQMVQPSADLI